MSSRCFVRAGCAWRAACACVVAGAWLLAGCQGEVGEQGDAGGATDRADVGTCGDAVCAAEEGEDCQSCAADCGACAVCGDQTCDASQESCASCPADCGDCGECGDGTCLASAGEDCKSCPADCGKCAGCGDGTCDGAGGESCSSCPDDCPCKSCGDGTCDAAAGESCASCPDDCDCPGCGNGECSPDKGEDCKTCPADCKACPAFAGCVQGSFKAYHGTMHAHTSYSDGKLTPAAAFAYVDDPKGRKLDFFLVTDHMGQMSPSFWQNCWKDADAAYLPRTFVTGCGYEICLDNGHYNVLFTHKRVGRPASLAELYADLGGCAGCIGQWNHPPWPGDFSGYKFFPAGKEAMSLMEFSGGTTFAQKWSSYSQALEQGWRISPAMNEDNHQVNWGDTQRATGAWMTDLTRPALRDALEARRTFATPDKGAKIKLLADDVCWMGSRLKGTGTTKITVVAQDRQPGDGFAKIEIYGPAKKLLHTHGCAGANPCTTHFKMTIKSSTYVYAFADQQDGDRLVSAPIWYAP